MIALSLFLAQIICAQQTPPPAIFDPYKPYIDPPIKVGIRVEPIAEFVANPDFDSERQLLLPVSTLYSFEADVSGDGRPETFMTIGSSNDDPNSWYFVVYSPSDDGYSRFTSVALPPHELFLGQVATFRQEGRDIAMPHAGLVTMQSDEPGVYYGRAYYIADGSWVTQRLGEFNDPALISRQISKRPPMTRIDVNAWIAEQTEKSGGVQPSLYDPFEPVDLRARTAAVKDPIEECIANAYSSDPLVVVQRFEGDISGDGLPEIFLRGIWEYYVQHPESDPRLSWWIYSPDGGAYLRRLDTNELRSKQSSFAKVENYQVEGRSISTPVTSLIWYEIDPVTKRRLVYAYYIMNDQLMLQRFGAIEDQSFFDHYFQNKPVITEIDVAQWKAEHPEAVATPAEPETQPTPEPEN